MSDEYSCDKLISRRTRRCGRKPYAEVYVIGRYSWSYLCRWHYWMDILKCKILKIETHGYYILEEKDRYENDQERNNKDDVCICSMR